MNEVQSKYVIIAGSYDDLDVIAFRFRSRGIEIRDCLSVQMTEGPLFVLLGRRELDDSIVRSVVREGTGALDIDNTRITIQAGDTKQAIAGVRTIKRGIAEGGCSYEKGSGAEFTDEGRWPANLIFVHGEGCRKVGTKKVKNTSGSVSGNEPSVVTKNIYGDFQGRKSFNAYKNENGKEVVPDCQPSCPVKLLDEQSFDMGIHGAGSARSGGLGKTGNNKSIFCGDHKENGARYGDEGGASRFFKQVKSEDELDEYLNRLIRGDADHE